MTSAALPMSAAPPGHSTMREGLTVGVIGATSVAAWFLIIDLLGGRPFYTPSTLGFSVFTLFNTEPTSTLASVLSYTVVHYALFTALGLVLVAAIHRAHAHPSILALLLMLFVCFQLAFLGIVAIMAESRLGQFAWYQVGAANLIATVLMGTYLFRTHRQLGRILDRGIQSDELTERDRQLLEAE